MFCKKFSKIQQSASHLNTIAKLILSKFNFILFKKYFIQIYIKYIETG